MTQTIDCIAADYNATLRHEYETIRKQTKAGTLPLNERIEACERASSAYVLAQDEEWERKRQRAIDEAVPSIQFRYSSAMLACSNGWLTCLWTNICRGIITTK